MRKRITITIEDRRIEGERRNSAPLGDPLTGPVTGRRKWGRVEPTATNPLGQDRRTAPATGTGSPPWLS